MPSTSTAPAVGASSPPARLSSVDLPEPDGPMTATSSPGCDGQADVAQRVDGGVAGAVDAADVTQFEHAHRTASSDGAGAADGRAPARRRAIRVSQWSSQRTSASAWKIIDSRTSSQAASAIASAPALSRVAPAGCAASRALDLDDLADVDAGRGERERELDRELVARPDLARDRLLEPLLELVAALRR